MPQPAPSAARSALWNHLGKAGDYALMYVASVLIARGLGVDLYGRYAAIISVLHVLLVASSFGLEVALTRHCAALTGDTVQERIRFLFRRSIALRVTLFAFAAIVGLAVMAVPGWISPGANVVVIVLVLGYALSRAVLPLSVAVLTARFQTERVAILSIAGRLLEITGLLIAGTHGLSPAAVLGVLCAAGLIQIFLHLAWCSGNWWGKEIALPLAPVMLFGGVYWVNTFVDYFLGRQGDVALLAWLGGDPAATARYDVSYSLMQAGAMVATLGLSGVSLAALSRYAAGDDAPRKQMYETLVRINSFLTIPVLGFLVVAAADILQIIYAGPFVAAATVLRILAGIRIVTRIFAGGENADLLLSMDMVRPLVAIGLIAAGVTVALHFVLIPLYAAEGAAVASGLGTLVANGLGLRQARAALPVRFQWRSWLTLTGITAAAGLIAHIVLPSAPTVPMLVLKLLLFSGSWYFIGIFLRPLESHDGERLGSTLPFLRLPLLMISMRPGGVR
jgi:O-antigen/teichoic acid export membrane protein